MKTFVNAVCTVLIFGGLMAMAGSANDCDGACMEQANTVGEMLTVALFGLIALVIGVYGVVKANANQ